MSSGKFGEAREFDLDGASACAGRSRTRERRQDLELELGAAGAAARPDEGAVVVVARDPAGTALLRRRLAERTIALPWVRKKFWKTWCEALAPTPEAAPGLPRIRGRWTRPESLTTYAGSRAGLRRRRGGGWRRRRQSRWRAPRSSATSSAVGRNGSAIARPLSSSIAALQLPVDLADDHGRPRRAAPNRAAARRRSAARSLGVVPRGRRSDLSKLLDIDCRTIDTPHGVRRTIQV